jgi:transcriptional regulator with XRE-family HTH domain
MSFGEVLRQVREQAGLTQAGLAQRSGVPLRTIQGWEQGYRRPISPDFFRIVRALGVPADTFASIEEPRERKPMRRTSRGRPRKEK